MHIIWEGTTMIFKDYYKILGLESCKVTNEEIRVAYREQAKKYHPDVIGRDNFSEERFKDINEAYDVLTNDEKTIRTYYCRKGYYCTFLS